MVYPVGEKITAGKQDRDEQEVIEYLAQLAQLGSVPRGVYTEWRSDRAEIRKIMNRLPDDRMLQAA